MFLFPGQREIPNKEANILQRSNIHHELLRLFKVNINRLVDRKQAYNKKFRIQTTSLYRCTLNSHTFTKMISTSFLTKSAM